MKNSVAKRYLRNCWYVAAWATEIGEKVLGRTILEERVAFFRDERGTIRALADRCPHRFVPLSLGTVRDGRLECGYHGLQFAGTGQCVHNPHGATPANVRVKAYPVIERYSAIWIWMGDKPADPTLIPDYSVNDPEHNHVGGSYLHLKGNYQFATDNILDLGHVPFVHKATLGGLFTTAEHEEFKVRRDGNSIWADRRWQGFKWQDPSMAERFGGSPDALYDRWANVRWNAPACMLLHAGTVPAGTQPTSETPLAHHTHIFTPETWRTCHYWFGVTHPKSSRTATAETTKADVEFLRKPFALEDEPMLAAQQLAFGDEDFWEARPLVIEGDAAGVRARRALAKLMSQENGSPEPPDLG